METRFSLVHAATTTVNRRPLWNSLHREGEGVPWIILGDFNVITSPMEKLGGLPFNSTNASDFLEFMADNSLTDLEYLGSRFTWSNNREGQERILERLDRGLVNEGWREGPLQVEVKHLNRSQSDHNPLLVTISNPSITSIPRSFRFINAWCSVDSFQNCVKASWSTAVVGRPIFRLAAKLKHLKATLKTWNRDICGNFHQRARAAEDEVLRTEIAFDIDQSEANREAYHKAKAELTMANNLEEQVLRQKARVKWYTDGDRNTKYFHSVVKEKRRKSRISRIKRTDGSLVESNVEIQQEAINFFQALLSQDQEDISRMDMFVERWLQGGVTSVDNDFLTTPPSSEEVKSTVFSMDGDSVAGPDGFIVTFFREMWEVVGEDVFQAVLDFYAGAEIPRAFTSTTIVLLPKCGNPDTFAQYRPISLCMVINKIITKIMAVRIAGILPRIISIQQSAFVKGRDIVDNILLANELVSTMGRKEGNLVIKLDMGRKEN